MRLLSSHENLFLGMMTGHVLKLGDAQVLLIPTGQEPRLQPSWLELSPLCLHNLGTTCSLPLPVGLEAGAVILEHL
jgi:hypothetical protein